MGKPRKKAQPAPTVDPLAMAQHLHNRAAIRAAARSARRKGKGWTR